MTTYVPFRLDYVSVKVVKGNELSDLIQETHGAGEFQAEMADGRDRNKAITIRQHAVALGVRGDYILLECNVTYNKGDTPTAEAGLPKADDGLMVDVLDFTGVSLPMQHGGFGRLSKFDTPRPHITLDDKRGIDKQLLTVVPDSVFLYADIAAMSTAKSQTIRGSTDSRITAYCDEAALASVTKVYLKFKPNSDGVFLIPAGSKLWGRPNKAETANKSFGSVKSVA